MKPLFLTAAAALAFAGAPAVAGDKAKAEAEIRILYDAVLADWLACDMEAFLSHSTDEHTMLYPGAGEAVLQTGTEAETLADEFCNAESEADADYTIEGLKVMDDMALVYGSGHYESAASDGREALDISYNFTDVLVNGDEGWKFLHTHFGTR